MKKHILIILALLSIVTGCTMTDATASSQYFRLVKQDVQAGYDKFELYFQQLFQTTDQTLALQSDAQTVFSKLHKKLAEDTHLSVAEQRLLSKHFAEYRKNRDSLNQIMHAYRAYGHPEVTIAFPAEGPSRSNTATGQESLGRDLKLAINPEDDLGRLMILESKMWLATKMMVFDNYVVILVRYLKNDDLRRQFDLQYIDPASKKFFNEIAEELDDENFEYTLRMLELVHRVREFERSNPESLLAKDKDNHYLNNLLDTSYSYQRIPSLSLSEEIEIDLAVLSNSFYDEMADMARAATHEISGLFGNVIGLYEERAGKLSKMSEEEVNETKSRLQILDILFEKTPFRLTDNFIPGHWGHVAIWVGGKADIPELKRLGVWQKLPELEANARSDVDYQGPSFQTMIEQDRGVLEALREGVQLNSFTHFLNIDDLAVVRDLHLTDSRKRKYLLRAFAQIGKGYDFNFDVETKDTIVCSELIFRTYYDVDWPVAKSYGRYTVSPDHVATQAVGKNARFEPILLFHDGKKLPVSANKHNFRALLKGEYSKVVFNE